MLIADLPANETDRLVALHQCQILDTMPETEYDALAALAAQVCETPTGLISLVDAERQWFKARICLEAQQTSRDNAFCSHAILRPEDVMVVPDALKDQRFCDNPLVTGPPYIRFYAGAPIILKPVSKYETVGDITLPLALGTVCVLDYKPRDFNVAQATALKTIADQVSKLINLRLQHLITEQYVAQLHETTEKFRESEHNLLEAQQLAGLGSWSYDLMNRAIT